MEDINKKEKFDPLKYVSNYTKEHYDKITIIAPKGTKESVMKSAKDSGMSASKYILGAIKFYEKNADPDSEKDK